MNLKADGDRAEDLDLPKGRVTGALHKEQEGQGT